MISLEIELFGVINLNIFFFNVVSQIQQLVGLNETFQIDCLEQTIHILSTLLVGYHKCPLSVLAPIRLLIYVNDMSQAVKSNLFWYADDSCLVVQGKDVIEIEKQLNETLQTSVDVLWIIDLVFSLAKIRQNLYVFLLSVK